MRRILAGILAGTLGLAAGSAQAGPVSWTDWQTAGADVVTGELTVGATTVDVTFTGVYSLAQTAGGTDYWVPSAPYDSSALIDNAPPASDIIQLTTGGTVTVTFSEPVEDPLFALVSWNGNVVDFSDPITIISSGTGFWGSGSFVSVTPTGFTGSGELHGVIRVPGVHSSITFTHTSEGWHGFTVGVVGLAPDPGDPQASVPAPASLALFGIGLVGLGIARRRRG